MADRISEQLKSLPGYLIRRAHQVSAAILNDELGPYGITPSQFAVLRVVEAMPDSDQISIANIAKLDRSTMTLVMAKLERDGLVSRRKHATDLRKKTLALTENGQILLNSARSQAYNATQRQLAPFQPHEAVEFMRLLRRFVEALENGPSEPPAEPKEKQSSSHYER